jgi:hypothetical protein
VSRWGVNNSQHVGRCSCCGGSVTLPIMWQSIVTPKATCESCGAVADVGGPVIPTTKPEPSSLAERAGAPPRRVLLG